MKVLNSQELREKINSGEKFIVDMYADWCGPCRILGPIVERVGEQLKSEGHQVSIYKFDIETDQRLASELGVRSIPTIKAFGNGQNLVTRIGVLQEGQIIEMANSIL